MTSDPSSTKSNSDEQPQMRDFPSLLCVYNPPELHAGWGRFLALNQNTLMARSKILKLYSTGYQTANASAFVTVPQDGVITGIAWSQHTVCGAGVTGYLATELALNSSIGSFGTNDTPGNVVSGIRSALNITSGTVSVNHSVGAMGVPVKSGDRLYLHHTAGGTAAASANTECWVTLTS